MQIIETYARQENSFVDVIAYVFQQAGYDVQKEVRFGDVSFDLVAKDGQKTLAIEVKYVTSTIGKAYFSIEHAIQHTVTILTKANMIPVLVITGILENTIKDHYKAEYPELIIIDTANLLFIAQNDSKTYNMIVSALPDVVNEVEPIEPDKRINLSWLEHGDEFQNIINSFETCPVGKSGATLFEKACFKALSYAFSEDLTLWEEQKRSNDGLFRFDLICRIKDGNQKSFWKIMEQFFHTKYVVFEFKNHRNKITQGEILTTEKYLYPKALRTVGIIISANGNSIHAQKAARGVFRETGKLILLFGKDQLVKMCEMKRNGDDPSNFLMDRLDQLLSELEK